MNDQAACGGSKGLLSNSKEGRDTREKPTTSSRRLSSASSQEIFYRNSPPTTTTTTTNDNMIQYDKIRCSMCLKDDIGSLSNMQQNDQLKDHLMKYWSLKKIVAHVYLRAICNPCIFKINERHQSNVLEAERLNRLTKSVNTAKRVNEENMVSKLQTEIVISPSPTPDTTPTNSPGQQPSELQHNQYPLMNNNNNNNNNNNINCHHHTLLNDFENRAVSPLRDETPSSMQLHVTLEVCCERSLSPLATESGGYAYRGLMDCTRCGEVYLRRDLYEEHYRSCTSRIKSLNGKRTIKRNQADTEPTAPKRTKLFTNNSTPKYLPPLYQCNSCPMITDTIDKMNKHKFVHRALYSCEKCRYQCRNLNEFEFHSIICSAAKGVTNKKGIENETEVSSQRKTRSQTKALSTFDIGHSGQPPYD